MRPFSARLVAGGFAVLMLAACGGGDDGNDPGGGGGSGPFTAVVEGEAWSADELTIAAQTVPAVPGGFVLTGTQVSNGSDARTISLSLYNIRGTGTYALGVLANVIGGIGSYGESVSGAGAVTPPSEMVTAYASLDVLKAGPAAPLWVTATSEAL